jgi:CHAD domain-containing protein
MTHHDTIHVLKTRFEKIRESFDFAITWLDSEDIHAFRVQVKKLRAFLHLVSPQKRIKIPGRLHRFYRIAGEIRNLQLQQQRIRDAFPVNSSLPQTYLTLLGIETADHIRHARRLAAEGLGFSATEERLIHSLPNRLTGEAIRSFTRNGAEWLQAFGEPGQPVGNDALHRLRKILKDLVYNRGYFENEAVGILPFVASATEKTVDTLIDLLGQYQDIRTGLLLLRPCWIDQVPQSERKMLEAVRTRWEDDKARLKHRILDTSISPAISLIPSGYRKPSGLHTALLPAGRSIAGEWSSGLS